MSRQERRERILAAFSDIPPLRLLKSLYVTIESSAYLIMRIRVLLVVYSSVEWRCSIK